MSVFKNPWVAIGVSALIAMVVVFFQVAEPDLEFRMRRAEEQHLPVAELGEPRAICDKSETCFVDWVCDGRAEMFSHLRSDEQIWAYTRSGATVFLVLVDQQKKVQRVLRCKS